MLKDNNLNFSTVSFLSNKTHKQRLKFEIIPDDILLTLKGRIGFTRIISRTLKEGSTSENITRIRFKDKNLTKFNSYFLLVFFNSQFGQLEIESLLTLTIQKYLNYRKFGEYKIPKVDDKTIESVSLKKNKN